jgi:hypothetical protein
MIKGTLFRKLLIPALELVHRPPNAYSADSPREWIKVTYGWDQGNSGATLFVVELCSNKRAAPKGAPLACASDVQNLDKCADVEQAESISQQTGVQTLKGKSGTVHGQ